MFTTLRPVHMRPRETDSSLSWTSTCRWHKIHISVGSCWCLAQCRSALHLCSPSAESAQVERSVTRTTTINRILVWHRVSPI